MENIISEYYGDNDFKVITPDDGYHYFFAYYDMRATGEKGKHLVHRVKFMDRLPVADDVAEIGYLEDGKFIKIAETTAWNFQQGAMLQYHPFLENTVYYNLCENGTFKTVTHNFETGEKKYTDMATAAVSPDGKWGLSVNYGRIYAFRPGYGYAAFVDENADVNHPENDGIFLTDMESGKSKFLISYKDLAQISDFDDSQKILVNHITFNRTSDRFVALVRNFPTPGVMWSTSMIIGDLKGNCYAVIKNSYVSHYHWISGNEILAHCTPNDSKRMSMFRIDVDTKKWIDYDMPYFNEGHHPDIHCNISPDGNYIIGDGYPVDGYRHLVAYSVKTGKSRTLLKAVTREDIAQGDFRCDLHARFVWGGKAISFDTTRNGKREVIVIPVTALNF